jgi:uncharacterized glyoxalase superfamily protein PhnB/uncharacterized protein YndB with AHSA1/START domain
MHRLTATHSFALPPATLYRAWTTGWDQWFAASDSLRAHAEEGAPFFFEAVEHFDDGRPGLRHPHYGRFLTLEPDTLVALTWVTGALGTNGAETIVTVRLAAVEGGTDVELTHEGFDTNETRDRHATAWPLVLSHQESMLRRAAQAADGAEGSSGAQPGSASRSLRQNRSIPDAALIPERSYPDMNAAVAWLCDVLDGRERLRIPDHRVQLTVGNGAVVVAAWDPASLPPTGGRPPAILMVRVADVDRAFARALALGFASLSEPTDQLYGERQASVRDPAGHAWTLTQTIADVDPASWGGELVG